MRDLPQETKMMKAQPKQKRCQLGGRLDKQAPTRIFGVSQGNAWFYKATGEAKGKLFRAKIATSIGTWNVRTLSKTGSLELLIRGLKNKINWSIIGLSEVRRPGTGCIIHEGNKLVYSGHIAGKPKSLSEIRVSSRLSSY